MFIVVMGHCYEYQRTRSGHCSGSRGRIVRVTHANNPWIPHSADASTVDEAVDSTSATGPASPQPGVTAPQPANRLGIYEPAELAPVYVIGTHGGSGESTLAEFLGGTPTGHRWPTTTPPPPVLLVARTHAQGLRSAQMAARSWASGQSPPVRLIGLVLVADAPGKLPRELTDLASIVSGGVPHAWRFPWQEHLRFEQSQPNHNKSAQKVLTEINQLLKRTNGQGA